jgi:hypothetical protein
MKYQGTLDAGTLTGFWNLAFRADTIQVINFTPDLVYLRIGDNVAASPTSYHNIIPPLTAVTLPVDAKSFSAALFPVYAGGYATPYTERVDIIWTSAELTNNATQFSLAPNITPRPIVVANLVAVAAPFIITFPPFTARSRWLRIHWQYQNLAFLGVGHVTMQVLYSPPGSAVFAEIGAVLFTAAVQPHSNFSDFYVFPGYDIRIRLASIGGALETWNIGVWYEFLDVPSIIFPHAYRMAHRAWNYQLVPPATIVANALTVLSTNLLHTGLIAQGFAYHCEADVALVEDVLLSFLDFGTVLPLAQYNPTLLEQGLWAPAPTFSTIDAVTAVGHLQVGNQPPFGGYYKRDNANQTFNTKVVRPLDFVSPSGVLIWWEHATAATVGLLDLTFEYTCPL